MARFFLSYANKDRDLARRLEKALEALGHKTAWAVDELIAGKGWGALMPERLVAADAVVALITEASNESHSVWCEIGAARYLADSEHPTALLPVVVGLERPPSAASDILWLHATDDEEATLARLVKEVDSAIRAHIDAALASEASIEWPRIFISHRHKDKEIAEALTDMLMTAFALHTHDIRCTSVQPFRLPFGKNTGERLRDELSHAEVVLGILSPDTAQSSYVMFELGAAWSRRAYTCPLLAGGAEQSHVPGPIYDLAPAKLWVNSDCEQLISDLEAQLDLVRSSKGGALTKKIDALVSAARKPMVSSSAAAGTPLEAPTTTN